VWELIVGVDSVVGVIWSLVEILVEIHVGPYQRDDVNVYVTVRLVNEKRDVGGNPAVFFSLLL
jgi:hypothetical protein